MYAAILNSAHAGSQAQQGRFTHSVRTDKSRFYACGNIERDVFKSNGLSVVVGDALETR